MQKWCRNSLHELLKNACQSAKVHRVNLIKSLSVLGIYENLPQSIDFVNKMKYNEYTNIDKLIYQIN